MQQDFSNQSFIYSGKKYLLNVNLFTNSDMYFQTNSLNNENILEFEYTNSANNLFIFGSLEYIDNFGVVDKFIEKQFPYCRIIFGEIEKKIQDNITIENLKDTFTFKHDFLITKFEIKNREYTKITYKLYLVSINWFKLIGNISYSNYSKRPETIIELIKKSLTLNSLNIDEKSFNSIKTNVKINYITNGNDNSISMIKYLLSKLYYYDVKDSAIKFIFYDEIKDIFCLFDILNKDTSKSIYSLIISMFKQSNEKLYEQDPINLATVTKHPKTESFKQIFDYEIVDYDFRYNKFIDRSIKSEDIIDFQNRFFSDKNFISKFEKIFDTTTIYKHRGTYWNNNTFNKIYNNAIEILNEDNALVVSCAGDIMRKPGDFININVDRSFQYVQSEEHQSLDDIKHRYKAYEGVWIIGKVHHFIYPKINKYRQNIVLFRNFVTDTINKNST